jgi:hypothetical protein
MSTLLVALLALGLLAGALFGLALCHAAARGDAQMAVAADRHRLEVARAVGRAERVVATGTLEHNAPPMTAAALRSLRRGDRSALAYLFARYADSSA